MKKTLIALAALLLTGSIFAQNSNLVIFSENGDEFTMYLNGEKTNETPSTNVKATQLNADFYKVRLDFNNKSIPTLNKSVWFETQGLEYTFAIVQKKNGKYVLRAISQSEISVNNTNTQITETTYEDPSSNQGSSIANENESSNNSNSDNTGLNININENSLSMNVTNENEESETISMGISADTDAEPESITLNMNVNGRETKEESIQLNMNIDLEENTNSQTTTSVTTTSNYPDNADVQMDIDEKEGNVQINMSISGGTSENYSTTTTTTNSSSSWSSSNNETEYAENINTSISHNNCDYPMNDTDFTDTKSSIANKTFEDSKLTLAKQVTKTNCLKASQIKDIMQLFEFESTKLEFAQFAYKYVYDANNYYKVNDAFEFEMTIDELNEYIENH